MVQTLAVGVALVASASAQQPATQAPPPPATGAISGVVLDASTNSPIADAVVYLSGGRAPLVQPRQFTDGRGRFVFAELQAGPAYTLSASKAGYLSGGYAAESMPGTWLGTVSLDEGEWVSTVRIPLVRASAIGGTVVDESGEPVVGVYVRALARVPIQGRLELAGGPTTTTDDRGAYRIGGLAPGRYVIVVPSVQASVPADTALGTAENPTPAVDATPETRVVVGRYPQPPPSRGGAPLVYPMLFAPGTASVTQATPIDLGAGEDRTGIDVRLEAVSAGRLTGRVDGPPEALTRLTLRLLADGLERLGHGGETATALVGKDGAFAFAYVPAGTYTLDAPLTINELNLRSDPGRSASSRFPPPPGTGGWGMSFRDVQGAPAGIGFVDMNFRENGRPAYGARMTVTVRSGADNTIVVPLRPLGRFAGRVVLDPESPKPADGAPVRLPSITLEPANTDPSLGLPRTPQNHKSEPDTFLLEGLWPGPYVVRVASAGAWMIKSTTWRGRDYTDTPFDAAATPDFEDVVVTVTRAVPVVTGSVRDERGQASAAAVVIFPVDPAKRMNHGLTPTRLKMTRATSAGTYRLSVPPGEYFVAALAPGAAGAWQDPAVLKKLEAGAALVTVQWGVTVTRDVTVK